MPKPSKAEIDYAIKYGIKKYIERRENYMQIKASQFNELPKYLQELLKKHFKL